MVAGGRVDNVHTYKLYPEWGGGMPLPRSDEISSELRSRLISWNHVWQTVLDPVFAIRWLYPDVGRRWIAEGESLVRELQAELGPTVRVVGDFAAYDPDAP